jgi:hypothetical protein
MQKGAPHYAVLLLPITGSFAFFVRCPAQIRSYRGKGAAIFR